MSMGQWAWKGRPRGLACAERQMGATAGSVQGRVPWRPLAGMAV